MYGYLGFLLTLGVLPVYALTNLAAARYFARAGRFQVVRHGLLPLGGAALMVALLVGQIVEQTRAPYTWLPWVIVAWVAWRRRGRCGWRQRPTAEAAGAVLANVARVRRSRRGADGLRDRHRRRLAERQGGPVRRGGRGDRGGERAVRDEPPASGWAEQDPPDWERGIARTVREVRGAPVSGRARSRCSRWRARSTGWWRWTSELRRCARRSSGSTGGPPAVRPARRGGRRGRADRRGPG